MTRDGAGADSQLDFIEKGEHFLCDKHTRPAVLSAHHPVQELVPISVPSNGRLANTVDMVVVFEQGFHWLAGIFSRLLVSFKNWLLCAHVSIFG